MSNLTEFSMGIAETFLLILTAAILFHLRTINQKNQDNLSMSIDLRSEKGFDPLLIGLFIWAFTRLLLTVSISDQQPVLSLFLSWLSLTNDFFFLLASFRFTHAPKIFKKTNKFSFGVSVSSTLIMVVFSTILWFVNGKSVEASILGHSVEILWWFLPGSIFSMFVWIFLTISLYKTLTAYDVEKWLRNTFLIFQIVGVIIQPFIVSCQFINPKVVLLCSGINLCTVIVFCLLISIFIQSLIYHYVKNPVIVKNIESPSLTPTSLSLQFNELSITLSRTLKMNEQNVRTNEGPGKFFAMTEDGHYVIGNDDIDADKKARQKFGERVPVIFGRT